MKQWGAPEDHSIAGRWYRLAIERGYPQATQDLAALDEAAHETAGAVATGPRQ